MPRRKPKTVSLKVGTACMSIKPPRLPNSSAMPSGVGRRYFGISRSGTAICQRMIKPRKKSTDHVAFPRVKFAGVPLLIRSPGRNILSLTDMAHGCQAQIVVLVAVVQNTSVQIRSEQAPLLPPLKKGSCEKIMNRRATPQISPYPSFPKRGTGTRTLRILNQLNRSSVSSSPPLKKGETGRFDFFTASGGARGIY